jgi:hypothetical protein
MNGAKGFTNAPWALRDLTGESKAADYAVLR